MLQLFKIMKEHKNPKVLSEGILWMVSAVEDFGVSLLKLKVALFHHIHHRQEWFEILNNYLGFIDDMFCNVKVVSLLP